MWIARQSLLETSVTCSQDKESGYWSGYWTSPYWGEGAWACMKVECYWLELVRFTSMHSLGSENQLIRKTGYSSLESHGEWGRAGVGLLVAQVSHDLLKFSRVTKRVASLHQWVWGKSLNILSAWRSMINLAGSSDLWPYVREGLSCQLINTRLVSVIRLQGKKPDRLGKPRRVLMVCWEHLTELSVSRVFNSHLHENFNQIFWGVWVWVDHVLCLHCHNGCIELRP